jgi:uncharacterized oxidoreductase
MKLSGNTILITGGSSGIGLELSKQLILQQNKVIICGRSKQKLLQAQKQHPELAIFQCDLSDQNQCADLAHQVITHHPELNILINNAALVHNVPFCGTNQILEMAQTEIATNLFAPIQLIHHLYPILRKKSDAKIINITTGLVFAPRADYPFYNSTKAGLHAFTQVLRIQEVHSKVKIIEVMMPAVDTPWHQGNPPKIAISPQKAVKEMVGEIEKGKLEIKISRVKLLYLLSRIAPGFALKKINSLNN